MRSRTALLSAILSGALLLGGVSDAHAQLDEFWPEVDVWMRVSPEWRFSILVPVSKNLETHYREGNLIAQADFAWGRTRYLQRLQDEARRRQMDAWLVRGGYLSGESLDDHGEAYTEHSAFGELHLRVAIKGGILLSQRVRTDLRWLGDGAEPSVRARYRVMVEKEYVAGRASIVPYLNGEGYYDSRYDIVNRYRAIGGATVAWSPRFALEGNWTYQYDSKSSVAHLNALNVILHVFFERGAS